MDKIEDTIRKLLAVAKDRSATPAEQENALTLATSLMMKHNITHIKDKTNVAEKKWNWISIDKWHVWVFTSVSTLNGCQFFYSLNGGYIRIVGRPDNIEATYQTGVWICDQIERSYKENLPKGLSQKIRANYRKTFKQAAAARINQRCNELLDQLRNNDREAIKATGSTALVVAQTHEQLLNEVKNHLETVGFKFRQARSSKVATGYGTRAGMDAGDNIQIQRQVGEARKLPPR